MTPDQATRLTTWLQGRVPAERNQDVHDLIERCLRKPSSEYGPANAVRSPEEIATATTALLATLDDVLVPSEAARVRELVLPDTASDMAFDRRCEAAADRAAIEFGVVMLHREAAHRACGDVLSRSEMLACDSARDVYITGAMALGLDGARLRGLDRASARAMFEIARRTGSGPALAMDAAASQSFAERFGVTRSPRVA